jgi:hypothetical protein
MTRNRRDLEIGVFWLMVSAVLGSLAGLVLAVNALFGEAVAALTGMVLFLMSPSLIVVLVDSGVFDQLGRLHQWICQRLERRP